MARLDVLIPTFRRPLGLAVTLAGLLGQTYRDFDITIADQTPEPEAYIDTPELRTVIDALRWHGHRVTLLTNRPARGMAHQRQFLLDHAGAPYVQYLDDDLLLEPQVIARMMSVIEAERCGFVGAPAAGLAWMGDERPHQQNLEPWDGRVRPEPITPETIPWDRHLVNNAANPLHLEARHLGAPAAREPGPGAVVRYRVAWVGGNLLYDREKLLDVGGFSFWDRLPPNHAGEEVLVQFMLVRYHGGCGVLPSGTYHLGLETTVPDRRHNAASLFADLIQEYEARQAAA